MKNLAIVIFCSFLFVLPRAQAAISPISVGIVPPVQFPPEDFTVTGIRVSAIFGQHRHVYGIDVGAIGNITTQDFGGIAVSGIFNRTMGTTTIIGAQLAGIANVNSQKTSVVGVQAALVNSNSAVSSIVGLELGPLANLSEHTKIYGFQVGLYNKADEVYGFQIGLLNMVSSMHGLQIGLVNINEKGLFKVCPIINFGF